MNVGTLMTRQVFTCHGEQSLADAARLMLENECGCIPVVDDEQHLAGIITDRDICMAAYTQGRRLAEIPIERAMTVAVHTCSPDDEVEQAEMTMQEHMVRRLPVVDARTRRVLGLLSLNDIARSDAAPEGVARTLGLVSQPHALLLPASLRSRFAHAGQVIFDGH